MTSDGFTQGATQMAVDGQKETHPSYGRISIYRVTGGSRPLFGSSIRHGETIRITISTASITRDLNTDWIRGEDELIEVEMSPVQFAELLTSMNSSGTPCTILALNGETVPKCEFVEKKEQFQGEFKAKVATIADYMEKMGDAISELKSAKSIKKSDVDRLSKMFSSVHMNIVSNLPFTVDCFNEQMERTTLEAKGEIEAYMLHKAMRMAQEGLNLVKQIDQPNDQPQLQLD
jgi:hypothetical protein